MLRNQGIFCVFLVVFGWLMAVPWASGQDAGPQPIEVDADRLEYDTENRVLKAVGHVVVTQGGDVMHADYAEVHRDSQDVVARGHVTLERNGDLWEGDELTYNFATRTGDFGEFEAQADAFFIRAEESERVAGNEILLEHASVTTCEGDSPDFQIKASKAKITDGDTLRAKNVVVFFGPVPVMWLPYLRKDLERSNFDFVPGYSSEMGAFLLTAYNYRLNPYMRAATHLDVRSRRGVGVGQDFLWQDPAGQFQGQLLTYYLHDNEPFDDTEEEAARGNLIDENRGRVRFSHYQAINERAYALAEVNWLSDPDILEDFFDDEFRHVAQPENRASVTHRGDWYTATLLVNRKLNDFYDNVNRVPEVSFDVNRTRIPETRLYYEGQHSVSYLEKDFADEVPVGVEEGEDYDSFRFDLPNTILLPTRHFGFLNVIPRVGYRMTFYSDTKESRTVTEEVETVAEDGTVTVDTVERVVDEKGRADIRNLYEFGTETSFKAFKVIHEDPLWAHYEGLRHVAEPFANYTYVPEPNLKPEDLFQFDSIDRLDKRNDVRFGVRNKFQTKRNTKYVHDLLDAEVFTTFRFDPEKTQDDFAPFGWDAEARPFDWLVLDFDGLYDFENSNLDEFNSQIAYIATDRSTASAEYRYRDGVRDQIVVDFGLFPEARWSFDAYWRYNFEDAELEEHDYFIRTRTSCVGLGLGFRQVSRVGSDDNLFYGQVWLLAFPDSLIKIGR